MKSFYLDTQMKPKYKNQLCDRCNPLQHNISTYCHIFQKKKDLCKTLKQMINRVIKVENVASLQRDRPFLSMVGNGLRFIPVIILSVGWDSGRVSSGFMFLFPSGHRTWRMITISTVAAGMTTDLFGDAHNPNC